MIDALPEVARRVRCLSSAERDSLLAACRETGGLRLETLVLLGLSTGARRGELLGLEWSDLNADGNLIRLRGGGGLRSRELPVPLPVMERLGRLAKVRRIGCDAVFADIHGEVRFPRAAWRAALDRAGIGSFRFQDLRHTMAAHLARRGAALAEIAQVLGARNLESVRRYAPLVEPSTPAAIGLMHEDLFDL
jgi:integrase